MIVKELIEILEDVDGDTIVLMSNGDDTFELEFVDTELVMDDDGEIGFSEMTDELEDAGYDEEDVIDDGFPIVLLT